MAAISFLLLVIRSRYGFSYDDEPFLLTLCQRLYYGDSLFIDEWNFAQNAGVLLLPFYRLYVAIFGSVDGIVLVFRGLYCFFWVITCTVLYSVLRKKYKTAFVVYLYLLLFSPLDQMILSYTSIGLMCVLLLGTLFFRHIEIKPVKLVPFTLLFSALSIIAVIASPYLSFVYGVYVLSCVGFFAWKRNETARFFLKSALWSVLIAGCAMILYVWRFMLNNYTMREFFELLPNMFATTSMGANVTGRGTSLLMLMLGAWRYHLLVCGMTFVLAMIPKIRKSVVCKSGLFALNVVFYVYEMLQLFGSRGGIPYFNLQMVSIVFFGFTMYWLLEDKKKNNCVFWLFTILGVAYAMVSYVSSDTGLPALSMGLCVCGAGCILVIGELADELKNSNWGLHKGNGGTEKDRRIVRIRKGTVIALLVLVFFSQLFMQSYLKIHRHYWDSPLPDMDATISVGSSKGIVTLEKRADAYMERMEAMANLLQYVDMEEKEKIRFLCLFFDPDIYLNANLPVGSHSTWTIVRNIEKKPALLEKMNRYYSVNPSKEPNVILTITDETESHLMPDIDIEGFEIRSYGEYVIYISPELLK